MIEYYPVMLERLDQQKWDSLVEKQGFAFHLTAWLKTWEQSFPFKSSVYLAVDNGEIVGGLPFCIRKKFKFKEAYSMPRGCYGGAVLGENEDPSIKNSIESEFTFWCLREDFTRINIVDYSPEVNTNLEKYDVKPLSTHILNLKYSTSEQLEKLASSHKRNLPKAYDKGFSTEILQDSQGVQAYFNMVRETAKRQGHDPFYRYEFYDALMRNFEDDDTLYWPIIYLEGKPIASAIIFIHRNMAVYWDGASTEEALESGANFYMFWNLIQMLKEMNIKILNFGASPRKRPGLRRFKSGWGAERMPYFEYNFQKPIARVARKIKGFF
ncbi:MAG: GNAT family N-acetyltransferase [candidate division Zixibacteria bacterium]|nr:GNAT family N-acetyltransferase [candidate division Zixibacteria bacterium]